MLAYSLSWGRSSIPFTPKESIFGFSNSGWFHIRVLAVQIIIHPIDRPIMYAIEGPDQATRSIGPTIPVTVSRVWGRLLPERYDLVSRETLTLHPFHDRPFSDYHPSKMTPFPVGWAEPGT